MTFCVLENFPEELHNRLVDIWKKDKWKEITNANPDMKHYHLSRDDEIFNEFPFVSAIQYYETTPHSNASPHLDRGRWCAINVPIIVDTEKSCFLSGKYFQLTKYRSKEVANYAFTTNEDGPKGKFYEDEELFNYYNLKKPIIFSTKVPHGYRNAADTKRVLCSITFRPSKKWEEMIHIIPQQWY